jgi:hypothetical protein
MKLKLAVLSILFVSIYAQTSAQDRINRQKLSFEQTSEVLSKATGWANNSTLGEWVDYQNIISEDKDYKDKYKSSLGETMMSREKQSFLAIQTKTITLNNIKYYVLIVDKWSGKYEYPSIYEDWYTFKQTIGYVFTENEFSKLSNIENITELNTINKVSMGSKYEEYDETVFLDLIQTELSRVKSTSPTEYTFPVMKSENGAIRFYLPDSFSKYSNYDFENEYFETSKDNFNKILIK